ncbi:acyl-CoA thioesterase [Mycolicibacterium iranicum]|uniref:Acyl-CoA thioesterase n=1 Tax=Mycolicibacterium iranicum TaxID=912594 RepID=A0A178LTS1_MYCIR|nr:thioesterase family protein [Mycolicibacterium iranicum]OAN37374.1 acyl-CoA thioesterase [Mycolicibacterium iranicum]
MAEHPFDDAIHLDHAAPDLLHGKTSADWANMVGPFGGMTAALLLRAVESHPDRVGDPAALTVNFTAPIADGEFDISTNLVRSNRTNQHWNAQLSQGETINTTATAVFGLRRDTWSDSELAPPTVPGPDAIEPGGLPDTIAWARNYDMRFIDGAAPAEGAVPAASSTTTLWARDRRGRTVDFAALTALSDIFFPRVFLRRGTMSPAGTISLTTYFHLDTTELAAVGSDFLLCRAHANRFSRGYFDQSAEIWSRTGELLVTTHQLVYFKA